MKVLNIIFKSLLSENAENSLLLIDIDDTLLTAQGIFIYRKIPGVDAKEVALTPDQYAKDTLKNDDTKKYYDVREFRDPKTVEKSIKTGKPILGNLILVDNYIANGWNIGILTARGLEDVIYKSIKEWLMYRDPPGTGSLTPIGDRLRRDLVFAVNDDKKGYPGANDAEKKSNVMMKLLNTFDRVYLLDDDARNLKSVGDLATKEKIENRVRAIKAKEV